MKRLILLSLVYLAGCDMCPTREPIIMTKTVEVPVPVKCVISYPKKPSDTVLQDAAGTGKIRDKAKAVVVDLESYRWYSRELEAAMKKCADNIDAGTAVR